VRGEGAVIVFWIEFGEEPCCRSPRTEEFYEGVEVLLVEAVPRLRQDRGYAGIERHRIRRAISVLLNAGLVHVERTENLSNERGTANAYRLAHPDSYVRFGTRGPSVKWLQRWRDTGNSLAKPRGESTSRLEKHAK
jgi:transposase